MEQESQGKAPLIGAIIIIIVILVGGFYLWGKGGMEGLPSSSQATIEDIAELDQAAAALSTDEIEAGLKDIEAELQ